MNIKYNLDISLNKIIRPHVTGFSVGAKVITRKTTLGLMGSARAKHMVESVMRNIIGWDWEKKVS